MELNNGKFQIDGINVTDLCKKYDTPIFVYDGNKIEKQYKRLEKAFLFIRP